MNLEEIISRFDSPKANGNNSFMVKCPCHNDGTQSLCISEDNGKILFHCFAGCKFEDITHAIGLEMKDLSPKNTAYSEKPPAVEYMYTDTIKKVRFYRYDKATGRWHKSFCWKHKDNNEVWQKGAGSTKLPLYKQALLNSATENEVIYIVEGEKDTDTMINNLHLKAVSAPNGATKDKQGKKWDSRYNSLFNGLSVAILPDNDEAGQKFAQLVAENILPYAKSVKIIDLTQEWRKLKKKGDISDIYENEAPYKKQSKEESITFKLSTLYEITPSFKANTKLKKTTPLLCESSKLKSMWAYEGNNGERKIDEAKYITEFIESNGVKCINGQLYSVDGLIPDNKVKQVIIKEIMPFIKSNHGDKAEKLLKGIKSFCYSEPPKPSLDKLHFQNGTLSRDSSGLFTVWSETKEFCINRINTNYNPSAATPALFFEYLNGVFFEDDITTVQQYCGYCLLPTTVLQKALVIVGDGGEGKSVLGAILNRVMGENNCYNASIKDLENHFGVANVENKLIYIDDDISEKAIENASVFKNLVTNKNLIEAKKKFQQVNVIKSYIRFLCFGNFSLQSLYDNSEGFYRRLLSIRVKPKDKYRIDDSLIDIRITDNEAEGVALWLIQGLNNIISSKYKIYTSERTAVESERIKRENDSVEAFLQSEYVKYGTDLKVHIKHLYKIYLEFCEDNALNNLTTANSFSRAVKNKGRKFNINKNDQVAINGIRARGFMGIGV